MKKWSILLATVIALTSLLAGCGKAKESSATSGDTGKKKETLIMATEATFRPYEYMKGSDVVGVDVEIAEAVAKELGLTLVIDAMNFDAVIPAVQSGKADFGAAGISIREDRLEQVDFSIEYATSSQVILTKVDSDINTEDDLKGKVIGVQMSTTADLEYNNEDHPDITVDSFKKYSEAALELSNGRIDAIILDSMPAEALLAKHGDEFRICEEVLFTDKYAITVQKGNTEMLEAINKVLTELIDQGKIEEFTDKHLKD